MDNVNLFHAFTSFDSSRDMFDKLFEALDGADPVVVLLALEGLYRIEGDVEGGQFPQFPDPRITTIENFLRKWRNEFPLDYSQAFKRVRAILNGLTIFKTLEVPMFIDDDGVKKLLSSYEEEIEDIDIIGETRICHVTHSEEAEKIHDEKQFKPSANKNAIEGCWFGLEPPDDSGSVYGNRSFKTTLSQLGVTGLRQGEIVAYKNEVNVILYATDDDGTTFEDLKKPTDDAVWEVNENAHVEISIFVPARFLPESDRFMTVIRGPDEVRHGPICVRAARETFLPRNCDELNF